MSWYRSEKEKWKETIETIAREIKRDILMVEKDAIQSMFLYAMSVENPHLVFKGGTSLTKAYGIINRFSEDLDISMDIDPTESERKSINKLIENIALELGLKLENGDAIKSRYDYNKYEFSFESLFVNIPQEIIVETSFYQVVYPVEKHKVLSFIKMYCDNNSLELPIESSALSFDMLVQTLERTFIDKVFAMCDYYLENMQERDSRHLYDICKIYDSINFDNSFKELVQKVRNDRMKSKNNPSVNPKYDINKLLKEIIEKRFYERDYNTLTKNLLYEEVDYNYAIANGIAKVIDLNIF